MSLAMGILVGDYYGDRGIVVDLFVYLTKFA